MTASRDSAARRIVFIKVDTLGDLVLFSAALRALRDALPAAEVSVVIRDAYMDIAPLLANGVDWRPTRLRPFAEGPEQQTAELQRIQEDVSGLHPDTIVAATSRRTWLETAVGAAAAAPRRVALGDPGDDEFFATQLRIHLGVDAGKAFTEYVSVAANSPDLERNFALVSQLVGKAIAPQPLNLKLPEATRSLAAPRLAEARVDAGRYVAASVAGFANVALKTWPAERFAAVLDDAAAKHGVGVLLIGQESERDHLDRVAAAMQSAPAIWVGRDGQLPELASILSQAALYVGNDTGAMHLAAALDVPVVAVFGGGTWPRFIPSGRRAVSVVHPLPCFGCGWDCAFGDGPCIKEITSGDVIAAVDAMMANVGREYRAVQEVQHLPAATLVMMDKAAARYHGARREHLARQHKLEELTALDREKDDAIHEKELEIDQKEAALSATEASLKEKEASIFEKENEIHAKQQEIDALRKVCAEREELIITLDRNVRALQTQAATTAHDKLLLEKTLAELPVDHANSVRTIAGQASHIRNLEALVQIRNQEIAEARATAENLHQGLHELEQAKHYARLLGEKEAVIRDLSRSCEQREAVIRELTAKSTGIGAPLWKLWYATRMFLQEKLNRPVGAWLTKSYVDSHWMQIGVLQQYPARPILWDRLPANTAAGAPQIAIVTPSYGQERFIERTIHSVLDQSYPKLLYVVQDGGSKDRSAEIIGRYASRLRHWESVKDNGQADAIRRGFAHVVDALAPTDLMAWLNSDDLLAPGTLAFVADYFRRHPEVDVVYGHRIIIDNEDGEIGRWIMPPHDPETLEWIDYVPQETMFWRKRAWELAGGIDPSFQFALDWDLLARFQQAGCRMVRLPYFLGAFRVHTDQKTTQVIHTVGADEMRRIRARFHGERHDDAQTIERHVTRTRRRGVIAARLLALGIRR